MAKIDALPVPLPCQHFVKCVNDADQPADYVGDWPEAGQVYAVQVRPHARTGKPQVHILGFHAERPYGAFATHRFDHVALVWLN